jgi:hypothetical protein
MSKIYPNTALTFAMSECPSAGLRYRITLAKSECPDSAKTLPSILDHRDLSAGSAAVRRLIAGNTDWAVAE